MKVRTRLTYLLVPCALAGLASGCAHAQARVATEVPGLEVPLPPPRTVETYGKDVRQTVETPVGPPGIAIDDGIRAGIPGASTGQPQRAGTAKPPEAPKPDGNVADTSKPSDEPRLSPSPLQTTTRGREDEVAAAIRSDKDRANNILIKIDYQRLNADARGQYESARAFIVEADEALKLKNLSLAKTLTDKALVIAGQLSSR